MGDVELEELLPTRGLAHSQVVRRASGRVQVKGTLLPLQLAAETTADIADFAALDLPYDKRGAKRVFELARGKLLASVDIDADKVVMSRATVEAGGSRVGAPGHFFTDLPKGVQPSRHAAAPPLP